jgi:hypothetical protein
MYTREAGAFILKITYGYSVAPEGVDPLVSAAENNVELFAQCTRPGSWLVDLIPASQ